MVQQTINNLKERPKDERKTVAGGIAIMVIVVLMAAWMILFFKKIQSGSQQVNLDFGAQNEFNPSAVQQAQKTIQNSNGQTPDDLYNIRNDAAASQIQDQQQTTRQQQTGGTDAFGKPSSF